MNLILLGASTRAAAFSAARAGLEPWCADLFADADLCRAFPVRRVALDDYPAGLLATLADAPAGPVMYTGALENYPSLIARIDRPLWGNSPAVLRRVRSPFRFAEALREHGLPGLEVRREPPPDDRRRWLLKPYRSGGGIGIRHYTGQRFDPRRHYLQEYRDGASFGAVYLGMADGRSILLGTTQQLHADWLHAPLFHYAGGVGPLPVAAPSLQRLGDLLAGRFGVRGLFGVDAVYASGAFLPLEVDPRYPASAELIERALGVALIDLHRAVFAGRAVDWQPSEQRAVWGKAVLYARTDFVFPTSGPWLEALEEPLREAEYADIPRAGERIGRGQPVLTVFASAPTDEDCSQALKAKVQALDRWLWP